MDSNPLEFATEMDRVEIYIRETLPDDGDLAREVAEYIQLSGGKKLRPRFVVLCYRAVSGDKEATPDAVIRAATSVELVHLASLLHDDVIDRTAIRRGKASVNAKFGDDVAILMADLLYARSFDLALSAMDPTVTRLLSQATQRMSESELFQIEKRGQELTEKDCYYIMRSKTAALFSMCAQVGGVLAGATEQERTALAVFGEALGMAYQITDDLLDYTAVAEQWGKPQGNDLAEGKQTLPLVLAFEKASDSQRAELETQLRNGRDFQKVLAIIEESGAMCAAREHANGFAEEARTQIDAFASRSRRQAFDGLCRFAVERRF